MTLKSKRALVTGGSRGIGRGIVLKLAELGADVAIGYHENQTAANETSARARKHGVKAVTVQGDVTRPESVTTMFDRARADLGGVDIFVANARPELPGFYRKPLELGLDAWDTAVDSQAKAFLVGAQAAAGMMGDGGRIIAITYAPGARTASWQPWAAMGPAKAALESLCRYFAVALARRGITVNAVSPGLTEDSVFNTFPPAAQEVTRKWHESGWTPMGRMGTPADVGNVVALLASPEAGWITGQVIYADGGASLMDTLTTLEIQKG